VAGVTGGKLAAVQGRIVDIVRKTNQTPCESLAGIGNVTG